MRRLLPLVRAAALLASVLGLASCATVNRLQGDVRPFDAPIDTMAVAPVPTAVPAGPSPGDGGGSIYASRSGKGLRLFQDNTAGDVGDLLTIVLVENTTATKPLGIHWLAVRKHMKLTQNRHTPWARQIRCPRRFITCNLRLSSNSTNSTSAARPKR